MGQNIKIIGEFSKTQIKKIAPYIYTGFPDRIDCFLEVTIENGYFTVIDGAVSNHKLSFPLTMIHKMSFDTSHAFHCIMNQGKFDESTAYNSYIRNAYMDNSSLAYSIGSNIIGKNITCNDSSVLELNSEGCNIMYCRIAKLHSNIDSIYGSFIYNAFYDALHCRHNKLTMTTIDL